MIKKRIFLITLALLAVQNISAINPTRSDDANSYIPANYSKVEKNQASRYNYVVNTDVVGLGAGIWNARFELAVGNNGGLGLSLHGATNSMGMNVGLNNMLGGKVDYNWYFEGHPLYGWYAGSGVSVDTFEGDYVMRDAFGSATGIGRGYGLVSYVSAYAGYRFIFWKWFVIGLGGGVNVCVFGRSRMDNGIEEQINWTYYCSGVISEYGILDLGVAF
jgi:hypothetical protein